jgi:serine-type D-Ala-D-Ala carboxypeptidase (penicillin-binding protein 5/6)
MLFDFEDQMTSVQISPRVRPGASIRALFLAAVVLALPQALFAADGLAGRLMPLIEAHEGQVGVAVKHLGNGESFVYRENEPMPTASLIKFPVMIEAYRQAQEGKLDLKKMVTLRDEDKVPGSGVLTTHFSAGATFSVRDAIRLMIAFSDNTATNLVLDQIGLPATAACMEEMQCPNTKIHSKVFKRETSVFPERSRQFGLGSTTAAEMVKLFELLHQKQLVTPEASDTMHAHLLACDDKLKFPKLLPAGTKVAHKTGSVDSSRTDAGIIYTPAGPIALCVLTNDNKDKSWTDKNAGDLLCARIAREVYDHFNAKKDDAKKQEGAAPGSNCVDESDAGGAEAGQENETKPSEREAEQQPAPLQPRDSLNGPPFVSCKAWAVCDARTGKLLSESNAEAVVEMASTTKIMTAYVILKLAESQPRLLEETIVFSERADKTIGSSCDLKAGDRIPAGELLYGLMLPSGNDAAVALGEHFGKLCEPPSPKSSGDSLACFVAEMNRTAKRLRLADTKFVNPNGLPEKGHVSTARDLLTLTAAAMKLPLFREIVGTRQHAATATSREGTSRTVTWKTTNRLLAVEGYLGVKTGYTRAAGSCLVSAGRRKNDELLVVVLGAPSALAAASDSRNLYRWSWQQLGHRE